MSTYLEDMRDAAAAALAPLGLRAVIDPAEAVPPCLLVDYLPTPLRETACGEVMEWRALLLPERTTDWLAAQWLAAHRLDVVHALNSVGQVTEEAGVTYVQGSDDKGIPAYQITFHA
jgi:hypothetical protein